MTTSEHVSYVVNPSLRSDPADAKTEIAYYTRWALFEREYELMVFGWDTGWQRARIAAEDGTSYGKVRERERERG